MNHAEFAFEAFVLNGALEIFIEFKDNIFKEIPGAHEYQVSLFGRSRTITSTIQPEPKPNKSSEIYLKFTSLPNCIGSRTKKLH